MKFATKALIGLGILAVGALYLKAKFDAAVDAYPDEDFEFDKSLDDEDNTPHNPFDGSDDYLFSNRKSPNFANIHFTHT